MRHVLTRLLVMATGVLALAGCGGRIDPKWNGLPPLSQEPATEQDAEIQRLENQATKNPKSKPDLLALAQGFEDRGRAFEAARAYQVMLAEDPLDDSAASKLLADVQLHGAPPAVVAGLCQGILARNGNNRGALWVLGELLLQQNQVESARGFLQRAWAQEPRYWRPALALARLAGLQMQLVEARTWCRRAEQVAPDTYEAKTQLATLYVDAGDLVRALATARAGVGLGPRYPLPYTVLGRVLLLARRPAEAADAIRRAISLAPAIRPNTPPSLAAGLTSLQCERYWLLGQADLAQGHWAEAGDALTRAVDESRGGTVPAGANFDAAVVYGRLGDREKAIEQYKRALDKGMDSFRVNNDLAYLYAEDGHHLDEALEAARAAVDVAPSVQTYDTLGWVQYQRGDYRAALENLSKASAEGRPNPEVLRHLGLAYLRTGQASQGAEALTKALQLVQRDDLASRELRAKIQEDLQRREVINARKQGERR
jgi:tetratricopeptide (TPR) repeat protein